MYIEAPEYINADDTGKIEVIANIYNALPSAIVKMRIGNNGEWIPMKNRSMTDPARLAVMDRENQLGEVPWRKLGAAKNSEHIWVAEQKVKLDPGFHIIQIRATDEWWEYEGRRLLHIK